MIGEDDRGAHDRGVSGELIVVAQRRRAEAGRTQVEVAIDLSGEITVISILHVGQIHSGTCGGVRDNAAGPGQRASAKE